MLTIRNFGSKSFTELQEKLIAKGFLKTPSNVAVSDETAEGEATAESAEE
jgi:beta-lactam-binding protein with PASTA domain